MAEQVLYLASLRGMNRREAERDLKGWFERLEVEGWRNREVSDLSKGMAQKIQFIATVLHRPELLILTSPSVASIRSMPAWSETKCFAW